jgi:superfamily II DNA or RNA helicase
MITLKQHQLESVRLSQNKGNLALFHDCGTGKTITALSIFLEHKKKITDLKLLVVVSPKILIGTAWTDDIKKVVIGEKKGNKVALNIGEKNKIIQDLSNSYQIDQSFINIE